MSAGIPGFFRFGIGADGRRRASVGSGLFRQETEWGRSKGESSNSGCGCLLLIILMVVVVGAISGHSNKRESDAFTSAEKPTRPSRDTLVKAEPLSYPRDLVIEHPPPVMQEKPQTNPTGGEVTISEGRALSTPPPNAVSELTELPVSLQTTQPIQLLDPAGKETQIPAGSVIKITSRSKGGTLKILIGGALFVGNESRLLGKVRAE